MARSSSSQALLPLIAAIGVLSFLGFAYCDDAFDIQGTVYCDNCRASFVTRLSKPIAGADVQLQCKDHVTGDVTLTQEAKTEADGTYKLTVEGDHEEEICEVKLVKSTDDQCSDIVPGFDSGRVLITSNNGITGTSRFVNALGFMKKERLPECREVFREMGLVPQSIQPL